LREPFNGFHRGSIAALDCDMEAVEREKADRIEIRLDQQIDGRTAGRSLRLAAYGPDNSRAIIDPGSPILA
jgi:hypothetical protein